MNYKERCKDCVCLVEQDGEWFCDEAQKTCRSVEECVEISPCEERKHTLVANVNLLLTEYECLLLKTYGDECDDEKSEVFYILNDIKTTLEDFNDYMEERD